MNREAYIFGFLTRTLIFPIDWLRWLLLLSFIAAAVLAFMGSIAIALMMAACSLMLVLLFSILLLPSQVLSLISNKQLSLLTSLKTRIYFFLIFHALLLAGLAAVFGYFSGRLYSSSLIVIFLLASMVIGLVIVLGSMARYLQMFMGVMVFPLQFLYGPLMSVSSNWLLIACIGWWGMFYIWWLRWQPKKFQASPLFMSPEQMAKDSADWFSLGWPIFPKFFRQKLTHISQVMLLGGIDGRKAQIFAVLALVIFFVVLVGVQVSTGTRSLHDSVAFDSIMLLFFIFILAISAPFTYCLNLHKIWMLFPGTRAQQFHFIERNFFDGVSVYVPTMWLLVAGVSIYLNLNLILLANIVIAAAVLPWLVFYTQVHTYHRFGGFSRMAFYTNALVFSLVGIGVAVSWIYINVHGSSPKILTYITSGNVILALVTILQRRRMQRLWLNVNYVRIGRV